MTGRGASDERSGKRSEPTLGTVRVMLQAGGKGSRMGELTAGCPKPLLEVGGQSMIERLLNQLRRGGFRRVVVVTGWLAESVEARVGAWATQYPEMDLECFREPSPLGTLGALALLSPHPGTTLLVNADIVTTVDFAAFVGRHFERGVDLTLASHVEEARLELGELVIEDEDRVVGYREKPLKRYLICSGIVAMEPRVLSGLVPGEMAGLPELVQRAVDAGLRVEHFRHGAFWVDVNDPERIESTGRWLREHGLG